MANAMSHRFEFLEAGDPNYCAACGNPPGHSIHTAGALFKEAVSQDSKIAKLEYALEYEKQHNKKIETKLDSVRAELAHCADRLETAAIEGGTDPEYAAIAVKRYREVLSE